MTSKPKPNQANPGVLGARNVSAAWTRTGLASGQQVIVYPPGAMQDGVRVKARKL